MHHLSYDTLSWRNLEHFSNWIWPSMLAWRKIWWNTNRTTVPHLMLTSQTGADIGDSLFGLHNGMCICMTSCSSKFTWTILSIKVLYTAHHTLLSVTHPRVDFMHFAWKMCPKDTHLVSHIFSSSKNHMDIWQASKIWKGCNTPNFGLESWANLFSKIYGASHNF